MYTGALKRFPEPEGTNIFDLEWDVLVILDACRVDALKYVAPEYPWLSLVESYTSLAGRSDTWMERTFRPRPEKTAVTIYLSGNPYTIEYLRDEDFLEIYHLTKTEWDDELNTMPARPITDHAIRTWRSTDVHSSQMVVHYMQPHFPSVPALQGDISARSFGRGGLWGRWESIRNGEISRVEIVESYLANLHYILDEVALLRENLDATVGISADHATALGEWGVFGHAGLPFRCIRTVPWTTLDATDSGKYEPPDYDNQTAEIAPTEQMKKQLGALGYVR